MSYPTQEQPPGVPQQPPVAPWQAAGPPQGMGMPPMPQSNGFATAGLILGILPTGLIGLVFSILGLVRSGKVGGVGRTRSWVGLVLSVLWLAGSIALIGIGGSAVKHAATCNQTEVQVNTLSDKLAADADDPKAYSADLNDLISLLNSSAAKVSDKQTAKDMRAAAADFQEFLDDSKAGKVPSDDLIDRLATDGTAVDLDCS